LLILIRKAINAEVLSKKGGNIYFDGDIIGATDDSAVGFLTDHVTVLDNILKAMNLKGVSTEKLTGTKLAEGKKAGSAAAKALEDLEKK
jgi:hypothetical protein